MAFAKEDKRMLELVIGDKNLSSWSLRPWIVRTSRNSIWWRTRLP